MLNYMKKITPNWTPNKNYLGGKNCQDDRDKNLIPIISIIAIFMLLIIHSLSGKSKILD